MKLQLEYFEWFCNHISFLEQHTFVLGYFFFLVGFGSFLNTKSLFDFTYPKFLG